MDSFTVKYTVKYILSTHPWYVWNEFDECYNTKTRRRIKQTSKNGMIGYCINGKFKSLKSLRSLLIKPTKSKNPFTKNK
jgi:hypothetical protein